MQYFINGVPACRVDVNGSHDGWTRQTHWHRYRQDGSEEAIAERLGIELSFNVVPSDGDYQHVWTSFAAHVTVELPEDFWTPLPGEWSPC
ncbi:hypothetical protein [Gordonia terrae]|uniref:hypothetical protein n=1 Tax=Gordonia terrae TaxID=2055 RepID=UPI003F6A963E